MIRKAILDGVRSQGMKLTPQRLAVIDVLTRDYSHPSAQMVFQAVREKHPNISLSTVYATLSLLKKHGMVRELEFEGMENRYDMDTENHFNMICSRCGRIEDFVNPAPVLPEVVEKQTGFMVHDVRLEFYGLCSCCRR